MEGKTDAGKSCSCDVIAVKLFGMHFLHRANGGTTNIHQLISNQNPIKLPCTTGILGFTGIGLQQTIVLS